MAFEELGKCISLPADGSMAAYQWRFVKINSSSQATLCGDGEAAVGVLQNDPAAVGQGATVCIAGITKVEIGGTVTASGAVASDSVGRAVDAVSGDRILGTAVNGGTAAATIVSILFQPLGRDRV